MNLTYEEKKHFRCQLEDIDEDSDLEVVALGWIEPQGDHYRMVLNEQGKVVKGNIPKKVIERRGFSGDHDQFCALVKYTSDGKEKSEVVKLEEGYFD